MAGDRGDRRIFVGGPMGRKIRRKDQNFPTASSRSA
jgi:hypothetical protein